MQTIKSFLNAIGLEQYHEQFLNAGATDQDLPQLVQFNDQELQEFLSALDMLPFHSIKIKRSLRELKNAHEVVVESRQPILPTSSTCTLAEDTTNNPIETTSTREFIISHATIYGKKKNRRLTSYEEAINNASLQLALDNPLLISKKGSLFDLAKKKLLEDGYQYKRGSSRSKLKEETLTPSSYTKRKDSSTSTTTQQQRQDILQKRHENAQKMSDKRLEKIQHLRSQVEQALKNRQATENRLGNGDYDQHDSLTRLAMEADLIRFEETKIKLTKEISKLKAQERKHQWYKRRKIERSGSSTVTDEGFSSQGSCSVSSVDSYGQVIERHSAFSICAPSSSASISYNTFTYHPYHQSVSPPTPPPQQQQDDVDHYTSPCPSSSSSSVYSSSSSSQSNNLITCSRESDVRASSISNYDR